MSFHTPLKDCSTPATMREELQRQTNYDALVRACFARYPDDLDALSALAYYALDRARVLEEQNLKLLNMSVQPKVVV